MTGGLSSVSSGCRAVSSAGLRELCVARTAVLPLPTHAGLGKGSLCRQSHGLPAQRGAPLLTHLRQQTCTELPPPHTETAWEMQHLFLREKKFHDLSRRKSRDLIIRQIQAELHAWKGAGSPPPTAHLPPFQRSLNHNPGRVGRTDQVLAHSQERSAYLSRSTQWEGALCPQRLGLGQTESKGHCPLSGGNRPLPTSVSNCSHSLQL